MAEIGSSLVDTGPSLVEFVPLVDVGRFRDNFGQVRGRLPAKFGRLWAMFPILGKFGPNVVELGAGPGPN